MVVVGGGIAGLVAALDLLDQPDAPIVTVLEQADAVGGKLRAGALDDLGHDAGAESLLVTRPEAAELAERVGLGADLVTPRTTTASIWSRGRLRPLPRRTVLGVPADLRALADAGILSLPGLLRVPLDRCLPGSAPTADVAVGSYVAARLGRQVVDRLVDPLLGGVYAGSADNLSLQATMPALFAGVRQDRSLLGAASKVTTGQRSGPVFAGIAGGVSRLAQSTAERVRLAGGQIRTATTVVGLARVGDRWRLSVRGGLELGPTVEADAVVLAVPAPAASRLLQAVVPTAAADLADVELASVALIAMAFPHDAASWPDGSGFLVPAVEGSAVKAVTLLSAKWGWVADQDRQRRVVRASVGRWGDAGLLQRDDDDLVELVVAELRRFLGVVAPPLAASVTRWGGALPQYAVGHVARVARIRAAVATQPGLAVCGATYDGVGIPAVIASAHLAARQVRGSVEPSGRM
ncbi:MAG: protoporphyrinogen oxidase [Actinomycetota bacterium]|nr:MAG: protoporphyrinogen oxidase [Actinomycetota bacterium]